MTLTRIALGLAAALAAGSAHARIADAEMVRTAGGGLKVTWTAPAGEAVDVLLADRPDAPTARMRLVSDDDRDGVHELPAAAGRAYVLLRSPDGSTVRVAERALPLEGASNFRDVGGYRTADGRRVRWGVIYRSAELSGLTAADQALLQGLGVRTIVDLRSTGERKAAPTALPAGSTRIVARDYVMDMGAFSSAFSGGIDAAKARAAMTGFYPAVLDSHADHFREVFQALLGGQGPVLYHCSAGKDRTGVTTALVLTALGVPRETVIADYLLSNRYYKVDLAARAKQGEGVSPEMKMFASLPPDVARVFAGVEPQYLEAVFAEIERRHGTVEGYLATLGVGPQEIAKLRAAYLE